jgi:hypothetical protein
MRRTLPLLIVALALLLPGCGGDGVGSGSDSGGPEGEVESTVRTWLTEGGCERMTDSFLEDQTFIDEPEKACETFENLFSEPAYGEEDIIVSDVEIKGRTASAVVSDDFSNVETTFRLRNEGGSWKIDSTDIN